MKLNIFKANDQSSLNSEHNMEYQYWSRVFYELGESLDDSYTAIFTDSRDSLPQIVDKNKTFVVLIGNEDYVIPEYRKDVRAVFTHYMKSDNVENVYVVPHGLMKGLLHLPRKAIKDRDINKTVFWRGWIHTNRAQVLNNIAQELNNRNIKWNFSQHNSATCLPYIYSQNLWDSKISLCLRGGRGPESFRYYESLLYGCVTLIPNDVPDNLLYKDTPAIKVEFNDAKQVADVIESLVLFPEKMEEISIKSAKYFREMFDEKVVAEYIEHIIKK